MLARAVCCGLPLSAVMRVVCAADGIAMARATATRGFLCLVRARTTCATLCVGVGSASPTPPPPPSQRLINPGESVVHVIAVLGDDSPLVQASAWSTLQAVGEHHSEFICQHAVAGTLKVRLSRRRGCGPSEHP